MAPNRKQIALALDLDLVDTAPLVQAKYLPLTTQVVEPQAPAAPKPVTIIRSNVDSDDYWSWSSKPAPKKDLFSAAHLESNLQQDVERRSCSTAEIIHSTNAQTCDDYWMERVEAHIVHCEANAAVSASTGYWDWPEDAKTVHIALILKEELARQLTSADAIEAHLVKDAATRVSRSSQVKPENDAYWTWDEPTIVHARPCDVNESYWEWNTAEASAMKEQVIANILEYERARTLLTADHLVANLEQDAAKFKAASVTSKVNEASDAYWCWPAEEDDYWNERPQSLVARAEAMPVHGYWDM